MLNGIRYVNTPHRNPEYGPGVGSARLERFNRAKKLNLNPPEEVCGFVY